MSDIFGQGRFVTGTGTAAGKTVVTRALAAALRARGRSVVALKPLETGCAPDPLDALALAAACGRPGAARARGFYRVGPPLAPYAATRAGCQPPPSPAALAASCAAATAPGDYALVEGAGGLLVPLDAQHDMRDLAAALGLPMLLIAPNGLGVLSHTLAAFESATARALPVAAVILTSPLPAASAEADPSRADNAAILAERIPVPVLAFPHVARAHDDAALAAAIDAAWLRSALGV